MKVLTNERKQTNLIASQRWQQGTVFTLLLIFVFFFFFCFVFLFAPIDRIYKPLIEKKKKKKQQQQKKKTKKKNKQNKTKNTGITF